MQNAQTPKNYIFFDMADLTCRNFICLVSVDYEYSHLTNLPYICLNVIKN